MKRNHTESHGASDDDTHHGFLHAIEMQQIVRFAIHEAADGHSSQPG